MRYFKGFLALVISLGFSGILCAQDYPVKPIRMIVPFPPSGAADILARFLAQGLRENLGKPVMVENRSGGGGHIGADFVAKSPADGYTLLVAGIPQAIGMSLYEKPPYDMEKDLDPITQAATFANIIAVHPSLPVNSVRELIAFAKKNRGKVNYGASPGSPNHLGMELLGLNLTHVPYKGAGQVLTDLIAGQIQIAGLGFPGALPFVQSGRLRALAVTGAQRSPALPNVPTVTEAGIPGYVVTSWYGLFAPGGTPRLVINKLNTQTALVLKNPDLVKRLNALGADVATTTPEEFARIIHDEIKKWAVVVKSSGAKPD